MASTVSEKKSTTVIGSKPVEMLPVPDEPKKQRAKRVAHDYTNETREQKLKRLAARRVPNAIKHIGYVGNLGAYGPSPEQVQAIIGALNEALSVCRAKLQRPGTTPINFSL